ncbi:hypothetical protein PoB_003798000 [Plakobranchus ocellatus]|uniref:Uncharacterized protein n=1 Tax=Plakobranchus ocellatus TaxID=259542 RepID=A0AAV4AXE4_9GAST|nr:hypothetical protein PoB_003798000 [Plakobranchus ocellatus]
MVEINGGSKWSPMSVTGLVFVYIASPQLGDIRLPGPPSGQGAGGGARTRNRRVHADLRTDSLAIVPPTPRVSQTSNIDVIYVFQ